jgi:hypothetical protein
MQDVGRGTRDAQGSTELPELPVAMGARWSLIPVPALPRYARRIDREREEVGRGLGGRSSPQICPLLDLRGLKRAA